MTEPVFLRPAARMLLPDWPAMPAAAGGGAVSTLRAGGISAAPYGDSLGQGGLNLGDHVGDLPAHVQHNRALLQQAVPARPVWLSQVHGVNVVDAALVDGVVPADASFTTTAGIACAILTADCLPVLLRDTEGRVVGAAHAGWRGLAAGILQKTVTAMRSAVADRMAGGEDRHAPADIQAWLGPAIGPGCFEVGGEVVQAFRHLALPSAFTPLAGSEDKYLADIYALARAALATVGVHAVFGGQHCTVTQAQQFYSYRRDRITGRQASLIWL